MQSVLPLSMSVHTRNNITMQRMDTRKSICYAFDKILAGARLALKHFILTNFCLTFGSTGISVQIDNDAENKDARAFDTRDDDIPAVVILSLWHIFALSLGVQVLQSMDWWRCHKQGCKGIWYKGWWYPSCSTISFVTHFCHTFRRAGITKHRLMTMSQTRMQGHLIQGMTSLAATLLPLWHIFCLVFRSTGITKHTLVTILKTRTPEHLTQGLMILSSGAGVLVHRTVTIRKNQGCNIFFYTSLQNPSRNINRLYCCCWLLLYSIILCSWADSLCSAFVPLWPIFFWSPEALFPLNMIRTLRLIHTEV